VQGDYEVMAIRHPDNSLQTRLLAALGDHGDEVGAAAAGLAGTLSLPVAAVEAELEALVQSGKLTRRKDATGQVRYGLASRPKLLGTLLVDAGLVTADQLREALAEQMRTGEHLGTILIGRGHLSRQALGHILQEQRGFQYVDLSTSPIDEQLIRSVPSWVITQHKVIPFVRVGKDVHLAMLDPSDVVAMDTVGQLLGGRVRPFLITEPDYEWALQRYFALGRKVGESLLDVPSDQTEQDEPEAVAVADSTDEAPVVRVFNSIMNEAIRTGATDVHVEPDAETAHIRFRVDGLLYEKTVLPLGVAAAVTSRLKVLAALDIAERLRPQDGRILVQLDGREYDVRIATVGTAFGERAAIRLLHNRTVLLGLERLGLFPEQQEQLRRLLSRPYGMILTTGPTGSGKTTTLYSCITHINERTRNIMTIEDPVEYRLGGITQIPVREKAGITFTVGLRGILRQDPDVVVVGEIRDPETASIAVHAALTGHLVLTSFHTSNAAGTLVRLVDMGLEPFLLTSSILAIVAQRLVRVLCTNCKRSDQATAPEMEFMGMATEAPVPIFRSQGCPECNGLGYKGRTGVFEILVMSDEVRKLVLQRAPVPWLMKAARAGGMRTLRESTLRLMLDGITGIDEFQRVILTEADS
jgi:type IV pilus assembly protein PilB